MKNISFLFLLVLWGNWALAQQLCPIIPQPIAADKGNQVFLLDKNTSIIAQDASLAPLADFFQRELLRFEGLTLSRQIQGAKSIIQLQIDRTEGNVASAYSLKMDADKVSISASDKKGLFYGIMSFLQLTRLAPVESEGRKLACWNIQDEPYYQWRGLMLDESRHFFGKEKVKSLLDWMAFYKLNRFHWHLTDEPGWRLQIKKYPKLALIGGIGNQNNPNAPAEYYTQNDVAEIVAYARERHIMVIPEIDMPGHATAANRAYPEYSGGGSEKHPEFTFNPGLESTYAYLTDILREVDALFPSQMIHIGGDEVHYGNEEWKTDKAVQKLMDEQDLQNLKDVEQYFIGRMADSVFKLNNKVLGWDEIAGTELPAAKTLVFWWRQDQPQALKTALDKGFSVVLCPRLPLYFDFVQDSLHRSGRRWAGKYNTLRDVFGFSHEKVVKDNTFNKQVLGMQANLWTETVKSKERLEYLLFPRLAALAAAAWQQPEHKDFRQFENRLEEHLKLYDEAGIYYYNPFSSQKHPEVIK